MMWHNLSENLRSRLSALSGTFPFALDWTVPTLLFIGAVAVAWALHAAILAALRRLFGAKRPYLNRILDATKNPTRLALLLIAAAVIMPAAPLGVDIANVLARLLVLATICLIGWIALTITQIGANFYLLRFRLDAEDNLLARKHVTQVRVLVRVLDTVIILVTAGLALMSFDAVRQFGVSLFASAGVAGLVAGLAARPVLTNLLAGVQLAVTQPIRLEDAVTVENEYGWIEEITSTYVVVRLWDLRRLIVPLTYFIEKPFYNWTRQSAANVGTVVLHLDYTAPVEIIRQKAVELVAQSKQFRGSVTNLQVTNATAQGIELRVLLSSDSPANTNNLCAELREKLIDFLQREHPEALPRTRSEMVPPATSESHEPSVARASISR
jgi:small-conductance mechanosensitive channel